MNGDFREQSLPERIQDKPFVITSRQWELMSQSKSQKSKENQQTMRTLVFFYGSLMSGFHNNSILRDSIFMGAATLTGKWQMVSFGSFPAVIHDKNEMPVSGELWSVPNELMRSLDSLEGHPRCYKRDIYPVITEDGESHLAWAYINQMKCHETSALQIVPGNDWAAYAPEMLRGERREISETLLDSEFIGVEATREFFSSHVPRTSNTK